jgi:Tetratricopeptide repeat
VVLAAALSAFLAASGARADDAAAARELFTQGNTFFDIGQFDKAIDAWQRGYQLKNDPGFLYNIGQAYRTMNDPEKAIFFYKRYLANAPKAKNRAEVEQKIEALQKQVPEPTAAPAAAPAVEPPPANAASPPAPVTPPPLATSPAPGPAPPPEAEPAQPAGPPRRIDIGVGLGFDTWSSGLRAAADPSFAFAIVSGYTFGQPTARFRFRLGGMFAETFLKETSNTDLFTSLLVDPMLVVRLTNKLRLSGELGLGVVWISGMQPTSTLLIVPKDGNKLNVKGAAVARGLLRLGVSLSYDVVPGLAVFFWPAVASSPKSGYFYDALARVEVLFGAAYRF